MTAIPRGQWEESLYLGGTREERENRPGEAGVLRTAVPSTGPLFGLCSLTEPKGDNDTRRDP